MRTPPGRPGFGMVRGDYESSVPICRLSRVGNPGRKSSYGKRLRSLEYITDTNLENTSVSADELPGSLRNLFVSCPLPVQEHATRCTETVKAPFRAAALGFCVTYAALHSHKTSRGTQPAQSNRLFPLPFITTGTEDAKVFAIPYPGLRPLNCSYSFKGGRYCRCHYISSNSGRMLFVWYSIDESKL